MHDFAAYTNVLLGVISAFASAGAFLFWRLIADIRDKVKSLTDMQIIFIKSCAANHAVMIDKFPSRQEWEAWKTGREDIKREQEELWTAINNHSHNGGGRVIR